MQEFAKKNNVEIKNAKIENINDNEIFTKDIIKRIFETKKGAINLITDSMLTNNFVIFTENTEYKKFDKNSDKYEEYKSKAKYSLSNEIYTTYDKGLNTKYKVELNDKVINRVKNSF